MTYIFKFNITTFYRWYKENNNNYDIFFINPKLIPYAN